MIRVLWLALLLASPAYSSATAGWSAQCKAALGKFEPGIDAPTWRARMDAQTGANAPAHWPTMLKGSPIAYGLRTSPAQRNAFLAGTEVPEITVVTHQVKKLQPATVARLQSSPLKDVPTMIFESGSFAAGPELAKEATLLQLSLIGEGAMQFNAPIVNMMGGSCRICLMETGFQVLHELFEVRHRDSVELRFHTDLIYGDIPGTDDALNMKDRLAGLPATERMKTAQDFAQLFADGPDKTQGTFALASGKETATGYTFTFRRADSKTLTIVFQ